MVCAGLEASASLGKVRDGGMTMTTKAQRTDTDRWTQRQLLLQDLQAVARHAQAAGESDIERSVVHLILRLKRSEVDDGI